MFWFPIYLDNKGLESHTAGIAICWAFGMLIGGFTCGYIGDKFKKRAVLIPPFLFFLIIFLFAINNLNKTQINLFYIISFGMGISLGNKLLIKINIFN